MKVIKCMCETIEDTLDMAEDHIKKAFITIFKLCRCQVVCAPSPGAHLNPVPGKVPDKNIPVHDSSFLCC